MTLNRCTGRCKYQNGQNHAKCEHHCLFHSVSYVLYLIIEVEIPLTSQLRSFRLQPLFSRLLISFIFFCGCRCRPDCHSRVENSITHSAFGPETATPRFRAAVVVLLKNKLIVLHFNFVLIYKRHSCDLPIFCDILRKNVSCRSGSNNRCGEFQVIFRELYFAAAKPSNRGRSAVASPIYNPGPFVNRPRICSRKPLLPIIVECSAFN